MSDGEQKAEPESQLFPLVIPGGASIRPAGKPDECFYCRQKIGSPHNTECVMVTKRVRVRYSFEIEIDVPHCWGVVALEYHRNDGTWCANNALDELAKIPCLCPVFKCEHLADVDLNPRVKEDES